MSSDDGDDSDARTQSASSRFWLTNDLMALGLVTGYFGVVVLQGLGVLDLSDLPELYLTALVVYVGIAIAWAFGNEAVKTWRSKGGD